MTKNIGSGFRNADGELFGKLVFCLDYMSNSKFFKEYKSHSWQQLKIMPGQTILDVASGTGSDLIELASLYPQTDFIGTDISESFISLARDRASSIPNIKFLNGDAHQLPIEDKSIDAARIDRSLQHLEYPSVALKEMVRVTKKGGKIVACETDWETFILFNGNFDHSRKISNFFQRSIRNPYLGRELASLMNMSGLVGLNIHVHAFMSGSLDDAKIIFDIKKVLDQCVEAYILTQKDADNWWVSAEEASRKSTFYAALNIVETSGVVSD